MVVLESVRHAFEYASCIDEVKAVGLDICGRFDFGPSELNAASVYTNRIGIKSLASFRFDAAAQPTPKAIGCSGMLCRLLLISMARGIRELEVISAWILVCQLDPLSRAKDDKSNARHVIRKKFRQTGHAGFKMICLCAPHRSFLSVCSRWMQGSA